MYALRRSRLVGVDVSCSGFMEAGSMRDLGLLPMANSIGVKPLRVTCVFLTVAALRKEACPGNIHDLAHIPTQNCLAECPTKASAKADNLITAVKIGRLLDVDIHPIIRTLIEHKAFLSTWCRTFMRTREKDIFFLNALRIPLAPTPQEGPFHVMFVRNRHVDEQDALNLCEFENQDATKITSASADSRINFSRMIMSLWVRT